MLAYKRRIVSGFEIQSEIKYDPLVSDKLVTIVSGHCWREQKTLGQSIISRLGAHDSAIIVAFDKYNPQCLNIKGYLINFGNHKLLKKNEALN